MPSLLAGARSRPHLGAEQLKYQYFATIHSLSFVEGAICPSSKLSILWTRGSKTTMTEGAHPFDRSVTFGQSLTLMCTLFRNGGVMSEKLCSFALMRHGTRGMQTLAKCKVDVAPFAECPVTAPRRLTLTLAKGQVAVAKLELSISSRMEREMPLGDADNSDAASISSCGSSLLDEVSYFDEISDSGLVGPRSSRDQVSSGGEDSEHSSGGGEAGLPLHQGLVSSAPLASLASVTPATLERYVESMDGNHTAADDDFQPVDAYEPSSDDSVKEVPLTSAVQSGMQTALRDVTLSMQPPRIRQLNLRHSGSRSDSPGFLLHNSTTTTNTNLPSAPAPLARASLTCNHGSGKDKRGSSCYPFIAKSERGEDSNGECSVESSPVQISELNGVWNCVSPCGVTACCTMSESSLRLEEATTTSPSMYTLEASNRQLHAQLAASHTLARKTHARFEEERKEWENERAAMREELETLRVQTINADAAARQHAHDARQAAAALAEARSEISRLKEEKKALATQLQQGADADDRLAIEQDLQGKLSRAEQHREENARKLAKARKHQQSLLAQSEAEIELLSQRLEMMEDEIGAEMQSRIDLEKEHMAVRTQLEAAKRDNEVLQERARRREAIMPEGLVELKDELEMEVEVRKALHAEITKLTKDLANEKLERAMDDIEKQSLRQQHRQLAVRMTELEAQLVEQVEAGSETQEEIASAFQGAMRQQEQRIHELEKELAEARSGSRSQGIVGVTRETSKTRSIWGFGYL